MIQCKKAIFNYEYFIYYDYWNGVIYYTRVRILSQVRMKLTLSNNA